MSSDILLDGVACGCQHCTRRVAANTAQQHSE